MLWISFDFVGSAETGGVPVNDPVLYHVKQAEIMPALTTCCVFA